MGCTDSLGSRLGTTVEPLAAKLSACIVVRLRSVVGGMRLVEEKSRFFAGGCGVVEVMRLVEVESVFVMGGSEAAVLRELGKDLVTSLGLTAEIVTRFAVVIDELVGFMILTVLKLAGVVGSSKKKGNPSQERYPHSVIGFDVVAS